MSASVESIIAGVIAAHVAELDQTACPTGYCVCNERFATDDEHAAHQAAAVMAALTEAGTVEWGVRMNGEGAQIEPKPSKSAAYQSAETAGTVGVYCHVENRFATPWQEVEG